MYPVTSAFDKVVLERLPSFDCDQGWIQAGNGVTCSWRPSTAQAHRLLSSHLIERYSLHGIYEAFTSADELCQRVAQLRPNELTQFVRYLGVTFAGECVRHTLDRNLVLGIRSRLGGPLHDYAINVAPLLWCASDCDFPVSEPSIYLDWISTIGTHVVRLIFGEQGSTLFRRISLRLPSLYLRPIDPHIELPPSERLHKIVRYVMLEYKQHSTSEFDANAALPTC